MWIADLSGAAQKRFQKTNPGYAEIPSDFITKVATENYSLQSLSKKVEALTHQITIVTSVAAAMAAVLALVAAWLALEPVFWPDKPSVEAPNQAVQSGRLLPSSTTATLPLAKESVPVPQAPGGTQSRNTAP